MTRLITRLGDQTSSSNIGRSKIPSGYSSSSPIFKLTFEKGSQMTSYWSATQRKYTDANVTLNISYEWIMLSFNLIYSIYPKNTIIKADIVALSVCRMFCHTPTFCYFFDKTPNLYRIFTFPFNLNLDMIFFPKGSFLRSFAAWVRKKNKNVSICLDVSLWCDLK